MYNSSPQKPPQKELIRQFAAIVTSVSRKARTNACVEVASASVRAVYMAEITRQANRAAPGH